MENGNDDLQVWGDPNAWVLLHSASSKKEGWKTITKAMMSDQGCLVQVTNFEKSSEGNYTVSTALSFVPGVCIGEKLSKDGSVVARGLINTELSNLASNIYHVEYNNYIANVRGPQDQEVCPPESNYPPNSGSGHHIDEGDFSVETPPES